MSDQTDTPGNPHITGYDKKRRDLGKSYTIDFWYRYDEKIKVRIPEPFSNLRGFSFATARIDRSTSPYFMINEILPDETIPIYYYGFEIACNLVDGFLELTITSPREARGRQGRTSIGIHPKSCECGFCEE